MLPVANIDGVTDLTTVGACFAPASILVPSFVIKRHAMLLIADTFRVINSSTVITDSFCSINGNIFRFIVKVRGRVT